MPEHRFFKGVNVKIMLISPVRDKDPKKQKMVEKHVRRLEKAGNIVHWPIRDTNQSDPTGGLEICRTNFNAILVADEVHIWYDETSGGSKFDMGGLFMLVEMLGYTKKVVIVNANEVIDNTAKSFFKVFCHIMEKTK